MFLIIIMLILFLLGVMGIGIYNLFKVRCLDDFLVAGRRAGGILTAGSLSATIVGGSSTLGLAGLGFARGLTASWWLLAGAVGLIMMLFFVPAIKSFSVYTLPELIGKWYGEGVRKIASVLIIFSWLGIVGAQANAAGRILAAFLGANTLLMTCLAGAVFILYTVTGGQFSVIRTDLIQIILILLGCLGCAFMGLKAVNGFPGLNQALKPDYFRFPLSEQFSLPDLLLLLLVVGTTYLMGPDMLSRVFCSRKISSARRGILLAVFIIIPLAFIISLVGMEARALFPQMPAEASFPLLIRHILPPLPAALTVLALISAFLSSADTTLLTMSSIISVDLLGTRKTTMRDLRLITALSGLAALLTGIFSGGIIPSLLMGYTVFSGGLFIPITAGLTGRLMRKGFSIFCMLSGGSLALGGKLLAQDFLIGAAFLVSLMAWIVDQSLQAWKRRKLRSGLRS